VIPEPDLSFLPPVRRAREYRLYDENGNRYLDFYQNNGRAILGHRPAGMSTAVKNEISKGTYSEYPSPEMWKTTRALESFFGRKAVVYRNLESALLTVTEGKYPDDPAASDFSMKRNRAVFWRPFLEIDYWEYDFVFPVLPFPGSWLPQAVIHSNNPVQSFFQDKGDSTVSPILLCLLRHVLLRLRKALRETRFSEEWWSRFEIPPWQRKGPYLFFQDDSAGYKKLFYDFLREGILINPNPNRASVIPGECSDGEFNKFGKLCRAHRS
jgi:hypothetical protein